jgi:FkbM family methyltransferase
MFRKSITDKNKHNILKKLIGKNNPTIIEVGAHLGTDTRKMLEQFPEAQIYCFEPDPRAHYILEKYCSDLRFQLIKKAVSDSVRDEVTFYQAHSSDNLDAMLEKYSWIDEKDFLDYKLNRCGASSLKKGHEALSEENTITVSTTTLDVWAAQNHIQDVDLIWIDVQGAEREVFNGAAELLGRTEYIWTEYGETAYEGGMSREETEELLSLNFKAINKKFFPRKKGDLLFEATAAKKVGI